jgi:hypothetical protein
VLVCLSVCTMSAERARPSARPSARPATPPQSNHRQAHQMLLQIPTRCKLLAARSALESPRVLNSATVVGQRTAVLEDLAWGRRGRAEQRCPVGFSHGDRVNLRVRKYSRLTVGSRKSHQPATYIAYQQHVHTKGRSRRVHVVEGKRALCCSYARHACTSAERHLHERTAHTPCSQTHTVCASAQTHPTHPENRKHAHSTHIVQHDKRMCEHMKWQKKAA